MQVAEITNTKTSPGSVTLWWLGQSGFVLKGGALTLYLDPYLSTRLERITATQPEKRHIRLCPIPILPEEITNADYVVVSHDHGDHLDPETLNPLSRSSPQARFIAPRLAQKSLLSLDIAPQRIIPADAGMELTLDHLQLVPVPGKHNQFDRAGDGSYPYLGFIIRLNGVTVYHAGDTIMYQGLAETLAQYDIDIALLPINGGDPDRVRRGFMSNLSFKEAADLGVAVGARLLIPAHYGMFGVNNEKVENFADYMENTYPHKRYKLLELGMKYEYPAAISITER